MRLMSDPTQPCCAAVVHCTQLVGTQLPRIEDNPRVGRHHCGHLLARQRLPGAVPIMNFPPCASTRRAVWLRQIPGAGAVSPNCKAILAPDRGFPPPAGRWYCITIIHNRSNNGSSLTVVLVHIIPSAVLYLLLRAWAFAYNTYVCTSWSFDDYYYTEVLVFSFFLLLLICYTPAFITDVRCIAFNDDATFSTRSYVVAHSSSSHPQYGHLSCQPLL